MVTAKTRETNSQSRPSRKIDGVDSLTALTFWQF